MKEMTSVTKAIIIASVLIVIICVIPLYRLPLIINDELQTRYYSGLGIGTFFDHYINLWVSQGRSLAAFIDTVTLYLGFLSQNVSIYKIEQVIVLLLCSITFGIFLARLFKNRYFGLFCAVASVLCYTIVFEHTSPNAFVSMIGIPAILTFISLTLFVEYLRSDKRSFLLLSMILFFISSMAYEAFVTFAILYCLIAIMINHKDGNKITANVHWPIITGIAFFAAYIIAGMMFPSHYAGNKLLWPLDIGASLKTIFDLFVSSIPGYYLFSPKYQYMFGTHNPFPIQYSIRVILLIGVCVLALYLFRRAKSKEMDVSRLRFVLILLIGIIAAILPLIPTSLSAQWCGSTGDNGMTALPVSFLAYFGIIFTIGYIVWWAITNRKTVYPFLAVIIAVVVIVAPVQLSNDFYCEDARADYSVVTYIEDFVKSDEITDFNVDCYDAPDFYERRHALGFTDGYWTQYSNSYGSGIKFDNIQPTVNDNRIYLLNNSIFEVWHNNTLSLMSNKELPAKLDVIYIDDQMINVTTVNIVHTNGWYICDCIFN